MKNSKNVKNSKVTEETFVRGSGNVFADLGLADADELAVKSDLMHAIAVEIKRRGLTQTRASEVTGLDQADISRINSGKLKYFSRDRLIDVLRRMGNDVEIVVTHGEGKFGKLEVRQLV